MVRARIAMALFSAVAVASTSLAVHADAELPYPRITSSICSDPGYGTVFGPSEPNYTNMRDLRIQGAAQPGTTLTLLDRQVPVAQSTPNANGEWSVQLVGLAERDHHLMAYVTDAQGNQSQLSNPCDFVVDLTAPDPPWLEGHDGALIPPTARLGGFSEPGKVRVYEGATLLSDVPSNGWFIATVTLSNGPHTLSFYAVDRAGNVSTTAELFTVDVDAIPPTISITTPQNHVFLPTEHLMVAGIASDDRTIDSVRITYYDVTGKSVAAHQVECDMCTRAKTSDWYDTPGLLLPGTYSVQTFAYDGVGNRSSLASITIVVI